MQWSKPLPLCHFYPWSFSSRDFRHSLLYFWVSHTLVCRINKPLLSALCLILPSPAKTFSVLVFQSPVTFWATSGQNRKMYFLHSISGIASSTSKLEKDIFDRKAFFFTKFFNAGKSPTKLQVLQHSKVNVFQTLLLFPLRCWHPAGHKGYRWDQLRNQPVKTWIMRAFCFLSLFQSRLIWHMLVDTADTETRLCLHHPPTPVTVTNCPCVIHWHVLINVLQPNLNPTQWIESRILHLICSAVLPGPSYLDLHSNLAFFFRVKQTHTKAKAKYPKPWNQPKYSKPEGIRLVKTSKIIQCNLWARDWCSGLGKDGAQGLEKLYFIHSVRMSKAQF